MTALLKRSHDCGLTHGNSIDDRLVRSRVVLVQNNAATLCSSPDRWVEGDVAVEVVEMGSEDVHVRDDLMHKGSGVLGHASCSVQEGLR